MTLRAALLLILLGLREPDDLAAELIGRPETVPGPDGVDVDVDPKHGRRFRALTRHLANFDEPGAREAIVRLLESAGQPMASVVDRRKE